MLALDPAPLEVLDVGAGAGRWARLLRGDLVPSWWTGLEIHDPYVARFKLGDLYDDVVVGDVRDDPPALRREWDLVILGDVLEHMTRDEAVDVYDRLRARTRWLVVSLPIVEWPQGEVDGNPHEAHLHHWGHGEVLLTLGGIEEWQDGTNVGVYLARGGRP